MSVFRDHAEYEKNLRNLGRKQTVAPVRSVEPEVDPAREFTKGFAPPEGVPVPEGTGAEVLTSFAQIVKEVSALPALARITTGLFKTASEKITGVERGPYRPKTNVGRFLFEPTRDYEGVKTVPQQIESAQEFGREYLGFMGDERGELFASVIGLPILTAAEALPGVGGKKQLTTKILNEVGDRKSVSKQFVMDLTKRPDVKKVERELTLKVLDRFDDEKISGEEFKKELMSELVPLRTKEGPAKHENVNLEFDLRGSVDDYREKIYESPIPTGAGKWHYSQSEFPNYFAHTRVEDVGGTTRVLEVQSDLFQRGRLGEEIDKPSFKLSPSESVELDSLNRAQFSRRLTPTERKRMSELQTRGADAAVIEIKKLQSYQDVWFERIIREEIQEAALKGKTKIQFPTGETIMKVEGLGETTDWFHYDTKLGVDDLVVGKRIQQGLGNEDWAITEVIGDGKFKAVEAEGMIDNDYDLYQIAQKLDMVEEETGLIHPDVFTEPEMLAALNKSGYVEQFDISGKIDTSNPIYRFYEKDIQKYLKRIRPDMRRVTDENGVEWFETSLSPHDAMRPVEAFGAVGGVEVDEEGNISFDPTKAAIGVVGLSIGKNMKLPKKAYEIKKVGAGMLSRGLKTISDDLKKTTSEIFAPISTRLANIEPGLKTEMRKFEFKLAKNTQKDLREAKPFMESLAKKLPKKEQYMFDMAAKNGDREMLEKLAKEHGFTQELKSIRKTLDDLHNRARKVGYDIGYLENYFPRMIKDPKGFIQYLEGTDDWSVIKTALDEKATELGRALDEDEKVGLINSLLRGFSSSQISLSKTPSMKGRQIDFLTPEMNAFYYDVNSSLFKYIESTNNAIEARRFFGKDVDNVGDSIGAYVMDLVAKGKIKVSQEREVSEILKARFNPKGPNSFWRLYKNASYIDTMGSPISAITQLGDLSFALYKSGLKATTKALGEALVGKSKITIEDIGIEKIAQEFVDGAKSGQAVNDVFKLVGLNKMDRLGKETTINAAISNYRRLAEVDPKGLEKQLSATFGKDAKDVVAALERGLVTDDVKLLAFNELLDLQPVALSEMPEKYLTGGNGRIFYMLKTYQLKLFDVYRREIVQTMKKDPVQGTKNLVKLGAALMVMNATADEIKDLILGRETSLKDRVVDNVLKQVGFSKFAIYKARQEGIGSATARQILPPFKFIDALYKDATKSKDINELETINSVPFGGKLYYWWFGKGRSKLKDKRKKAVKGLPKPPKLPKLPKVGQSTTR